MERLVRIRWWVYGRQYRVRLFLGLAVYSVIVVFNQYDGYVDGTAERTSSQLGRALLAVYMQSCFI
ncbi:hypothetical protein P154DRAFT_520668 [Amniculicola lignicola CBS 123094]|uniref:Uncharacterized protein n=1 Tax=Amniculicola lignicola CBS 123094 TaxID=1392246 RepID=A0A6A5WPU2_9PLEO|nr:hypothetical protein P154DRAFT_520668 [Amniculicola lignicola CBS 123094]